MPDLKLKIFGAGREKSIISFPSEEFLFLPENVKMGFPEKDNIIMIYIKKLKKSILSLRRLDVIIIFAVFLIIAAAVIAIIVNNNKKNVLDEENPFSQINLYISPYFERIIGKKTTESLLLEYNSRNPEILIRIADDTQESDILVFDEGSFSAFAAWDMLTELKSFANQNSGEINYRGAAKNQLAVPLVSFMDLLFYNIDILSAAGFDSPPKTRDEFIAYSRGITRSNSGVSAAAFSLGTNDRNALSRDIFSWIWAGGGNLWTNGDKPSLNTRAIVNDMTFFDTLNREGMLAPGIFSTTGNRRLEEFAEGKIAMMVASTQVIPFLRERMKDGSFGITTIPDANTGERYSTGISSIYAAISVNCRNIEEAWDFLSFLTEKSAFLCEELKAVPGIVSSLIPGNYVRDDLYYSKAWEIFEFAQTAEGFSGTPNAEEYETAFLEELQIFFESSRTAQQTVNTIQRRWDEIYGN